MKYKKNNFTVFEPKHPLSARSIYKASKKFYSKQLGFFLQLTIFYNSTIVSQFFIVNQHSIVFGIVPIAICFYSTIVFALLQYFVQCKSKFSIYMYIFVRKLQLACYFTIIYKHNIYKHNINQSIIVVGILACFFSLVNRSSIHFGIVPQFFSIVTQFHPW